jgi:hypothetical protein
MSDFPLDKKINILEWVADPRIGSNVWAWVYTWASAGWMEQLVDEGLLDIIPNPKREADYGNKFYGGRYYYCSPQVSITDKGREFLKPHMIGVGEW